MGRGARCTIDGLNAEDLGRPVGAAAEIGGLGQTAGTDALRLTEDMKALRDTINANADKFDESFTSSYQKFLESWQAFVQHVSGSSIPWYDLPKQLGRSLSAVFDSASNFNAVQDYRKKFNAFWTLAEEKLGRKPTPIDPPKERPQVKDEPLVKGILDGVFTVALVLGGAYVVGNVLRR